MDFSLEYSKGQEEFAREVREWLDENVPKDLVSPRDPRRLSREQWGERRELGRKLGEKGWLFPSYPRKYGGGGLDADHCFVLHRETAARRIGLPPIYDVAFLAVPAILACGTEEQKERFIPPMLKGEVVTWQLFTEPEAGTDEANQQTNALRHVREGDYFIINGQKIFVGNQFAPPDQYLLLTRSDLEVPRHENLAMFLAPADLPGITIQPLGLFAGGGFGAVSGATIELAATDKNSVFFDDVRVQESYLIGGDHDGWKVATATLDVEHGGGEARTPGEGESMMVQKFLDQCRDNPNVVKRLKENPQLLDSVVNIYVGAQIQRLWGLRGAGGAGAPYQGPQAGGYSKEFANRLIADMAEVLGPYALTDDDEWQMEEGMFQAGQLEGVIAAPGGTPEAQKIIMSRALAIGR